MLLFIVGVAAGLVLYHAAFGFTSAWRELIAHGRGGGLRAQMLMLAVATAAFVPVLANGTAFGHVVRGSVAPAGVPVIAGAFLFGIGMQLGGGCASGTLFSAGGGSVRMFATLAAFIAGSVLGVRYSGVWEQAPALRPMSLLGEFGLVPALLVSLAGFAAIAGVSVAIETRRRGGLESDRHAKDWRVLTGPWTLAAGALGLAGVNIATLLIAGRPWGVTAAFALWGSKALMTAGVDVAAWPYWQPAARAADLHASVLNDVTSVMDIGIMLGALAAVGARRPFRAGVASPWPFPRGGDSRRHPARIWCAHRVRLQHRRVLQRRSFDEPSRVGMARVRILRQHRGDQAAAAFRSRRMTGSTIGRAGAMRLVLATCVVRSWEPDDVPSLVRSADNRRIWMNLRDRFPHPYTVSDGVSFIRRTLASKPERSFAIEVDGKAVGGIGFMPQQDIERVSAEIGYWLGEPYWGKGICTDALRAVTRHAIEQHGLTRIFALPFAHNIASCRVLEKAGYSLEGYLRRSAIKDGRIADQKLYACIAAEASGTGSDPGV